MARLRDTVLIVPFFARRSDTNTVTGWLTVTLTRTFHFALRSCLTAIGGIRPTLSCDSRGRMVMVDGGDVVWLPWASVAVTVTAYTPGSRKTWVTARPAAVPSPKSHTGGATGDPSGSIAETENDTRSPTRRCRRKVRWESCGPRTSASITAGLDGSETFPAPSTARTTYT